jgi:hypothetical protein
MKKLYERFYGDIIFVTILTDTNRQRAKNFINKHALSWTFLFAADNAPVISDYLVSAYPTYFLIDPVGYLKMTPAPSPVENIEKYIANFIDEEKKK